jgi:hypothetical protein
MKKILLITAVALSSAFIVGCSNTDGDSTMRMDSHHAVKSEKTEVSNTSVAQKYNRENSVSTKDIQGKNYNFVLKATKAEQEKAKKVNGEWNTIRKLMKKAKKDHKAGNDSAAIKKLNKAISHAKLGQIQASDQKNATPRF